jgi:hypothetical protein
MMPPGSALNAARTTRLRAATALTDSRTTSAVLITQHLPDDLSDRHPVHPGHLPASYPSNLEKSDDDERRGGRTYVPSDALLQHATGT